MAPLEILCVSCLLFCTNPDEANALFMCTYDLAENVNPLFFTVDKLEKEASNKRGTKKTILGGMNANTILDKKGELITQSGWHTTPLITNTSIVSLFYEAKFSHFLFSNLHWNVCYYDATTGILIKGDILKENQCIAVDKYVSVRISVPDTENVYYCNIVNTSCNEGQSYGSKVLWVGTSLSEGGTYPAVSCKLNGAFLTNNSRSSSKLTRATAPLADAMSLSSTIAELTAAGEDPAYSYENLIIPFINGVTDTVDVIVFEHGYNDANAIEAEIPTIDDIDWEITGADNTFDRSTFSGAFKYLLKKIYTANPLVKIIISGYFEGNSLVGDHYGNRKGKYITQMQAEIAKVFAFPILEVWKYSGFNYSHIPGTSSYVTDYNTLYSTAWSNWDPDADGNITRFQRYAMDDVHPYSDLTGEGPRILEEVYTKLLKGLV